jgi:hypothetical protein
MLACSGSSLWPNARPARRRAAARRWIRWYRISRAARPLGDRPEILTGKTAAAAEETCRFRSIAAHAYDNFDESRAVNAVAAASALAELLPPEIGRFRRAIDP